MGYRSTLLIVILVFTVLFSFMYTSYSLNYRIPHDPIAIPTSPIVSQEQALAIVENEFRWNVPSYREAYLHFHYYNFSREYYEDEGYQSYLRSLGPGWKLSEIKSIPSLLSLTLVFVHANGTIYSIDSQARTFEKLCEEPSLDCPLGKNPGKAARDRLVYEVGAIVEGGDGYNSDVHYIIDAETGRVVYNIPYFNPRPFPHRLIADNTTRTVGELEQQIENARFGAAIEIKQNASEIAAKEGTLMRGYDPPDVIVTLNNDTDAVTITWLNHDAFSHTVRSDNGYRDILGEKLDSGMIEPGGNYTFVFIEQGPYQYHCRIHPWMKGSISIMPSDYT